MQKCKECSNRFSRGLILKSIMRRYSPIQCDNCKSIYKPTLFTRLMVAVTVPLPLLFQNQLYAEFKEFSFLIFMSWVALVVALIPFLAVYKNSK